MRHEITSNASGHDCLYVHKAVVSSFAPFIERSTPFICILEHAPIEEIAWTEMSLPINSELDTFHLKYRRISYDILMKTDEFLRNIKSFDEHGIFLVQMSKPMPNTLTLHGLKDEIIDKVLIKNEAMLKIYLPHAGETGSVTSFQKGYLNEILKMSDADQPAKYETTTTSAQE